MNRYRYVVVYQHLLRAASLPARVAPAAAGQDYVDIQYIYIESQLYIYISIDIDRYRCVIGYQHLLRAASLPTRVAPAAAGQDYVDIQYTYRESQLYIYISIDMDRYRYVVVYQHLLRAASLPARVAPAAAGQDYVYI